MYRMESHIGSEKWCKIYAPTPARFHPPTAIRLHSLNALRSLIIPRALIDQMENA